MPGDNKANTVLELINNKTAVDLLDNTLKDMVKAVISLLEIYSKNNESTYTEPTQIRFYTEGCNLLEDTYLTMTNNAGNLTMSGRSVFVIERDKSNKYNLFLA